MSPKKKRFYTPSAVSRNKGFSSKKNDILYISPIQYNAESGRWVNYHEHDWDKRLWAKKCGGYHATGVDLANQTCRQCHGKEPIASINHYFSSMNPIRRHAYVCSKCHEGANASFAGYVIHEPNPSAAGTLDTVPTLFYAFWIMIAIAVGTFAVFLPPYGALGVAGTPCQKERGCEMNEIKKKNNTVYTCSAAFSCTIDDVVSALRGHRTVPVRHHLRVGTVACRGVRWI